MELQLFDILDGKAAYAGVQQGLLLIPATPPKGVQNVDGMEG